jgi:hypothetical protein
MDLVDIGTSCGGNSLAGGLSDTFYFARVCDIDSWPTLAANPTTAIQKTTYTGAFEMKSGKKFSKGVTVINESSINWSAIGLTGGKSWKHNFLYLASGNDPNTMLHLSQVKNEKMVFIARDRQGVFRVVGSELLAAYLESGEGGTGKSGEERAGSTLTFYSESDDLPYIYAADPEELLEPAGTQSGS